MDTLRIGSYYSRKDIHKLLGGGIQDFLPHKDGVVVCACVTPEMNPHLPEIILAGEGKEVPRWARKFSEQRNYVPMFVKREQNKWEYIGQFKARSISDDPKEIAKHNSYSGRDDVVLVISLDKEK